VIVARTRRRLALINMAALMITVLLFGATVVLAMNSFLMAQETSNLNAEARQGAVDFEELTASEFQERHPNFSTGTFYVVWNLAGIPVFNPTNVNTQPLTPSAFAALHGKSGTQSISFSGSGDVLVASQLLVEDNDPIGALQVGHSLSPLHKVESEATVIVALACAAMLIVSVLAGWLLAGRALIPIREALDRQKTFTADASHELRSPLTVVDTGIQLLRRHPDKRISEYSEVLTSMQQESQRMGRLVASLLALARADSGEAEVQTAEVDVADLVRTAVKDVEPLASAKDCVVEITRLDVVKAQLDADRFKQLIVILVDNAVTHGPGGSTVEVSCVGHDRTLTLEVADHGPGIPAELRDKAFERFHRLSSSRNGSGAGLGLAIAKWIVTAHGGSIAMHDNHPGLRLEVNLPLHPGTRPAP